MTGDEKKRIISAADRIDELAQSLHDAVAAHVGSRDRHDVATMLLLGMCRVLVAMYPERAVDGRTILEVMSKQMLDYPFDPEPLTQADGATIQ